MSGSDVPVVGTGGTAISNRGGHVSPRKRPPRVGHDVVRNFLQAVGNGARWRRPRNGGVTATSVVMDLAARRPLKSCTRR